MKTKRKMLCTLLCAVMLITSLVSGCTSAPTEPSGLPSETVSQATTGETQVEVLAEYLQRNSGLEEKGATAVLDESSTITKTKSPIRTIKNKSLSGETLSSDFYMYRNVLSSVEQKAYDQIYAGALAGKATVNMSVAITTSSVENVFYSVYYDHPELLWLECGFSYSYNYNGVVTSISPMYNTLVSDIIAATVAFEYAINPMLNAANTFSRDIEKVRFVHDYLAYTITYLLNCNLNQSGYSAVVNKVTVCAGYSHAFQYCMMKLGIPCAYITGDAGGAHAWNILRLDGEYYFMDVTWDDPTGGSQYVVYDYFCVTDAYASADHVRYSLSAKLPTCNGTKYSYANYYGSGYGSDFSIIDSGDVTFGEVTTAATTEDLPINTSVIPQTTTAPITTSSPKTTAPYTTTRPTDTTEFNWDDYNLDDYSYDDINWDDYNWDDYDWSGDEDYSKYYLDTDDDFDFGEYDFDYDDYNLDDYDWYTDYDWGEDDFDWNSYYDYYDDYDWDSGYDDFDWSSDDFYNYDDSDYDSYWDDYSDDYYDYFDYWY